VLQALVFGDEGNFHFQKIPIPDHWGKRVQVRPYHRVIQTVVCTIQMAFGNVSGG
jgi:hypothetical protein